MGVALAGRYPDSMRVAVGLLLLVTTSCRTVTHHPIATLAVSATVGTVAMGQADGLPKPYDGDGRYYLGFGTGLIVGGLLIAASLATTRKTYDAAPPSSYQPPPAPTPTTVQVNEPDYRPPVEVKANLPTDGYQEPPLATGPGEFHDEFSRTWYGSTPRLTCLEAKRIAFGDLLTHNCPFGIASPGAPVYRLRAYRVYAAPCSCVFDSVLRQTMCTTKVEGVCSPNPPVTPYFGYARGFNRPNAETLAIKAAAQRCAVGSDSSPSIFGCFEEAGAWYCAASIHCRN